MALIAFDLDGTAGEVIMKLMVDSDDFVFSEFQNIGGLK